MPDPTAGAGQRRVQTSTSRRAAPLALSGNLLLTAALMLSAGGAEAVGETAIVKASHDPVNPSDDEDPAMSADGRFIAFRSVTNLTSPGLNVGIYLLDRHTQTVVRIADALSDPKNNSPERPAVSADGRFVAFDSGAANLVPGDTNDRVDVFVYDRLTRSSARVSIGTDGTQGTGGSFSAALSADGRIVAFVSYADNLVPGDTNGVPDVFVHDRLTGKTTRVSVDSAEKQANAGSGDVPIGLSADGRHVAFSSYASNLVPDDTNARRDVFVHDRASRQTTRVSVDSSGKQGYGPEVMDGVERQLAISADGRIVAFGSHAATLVPGDTNQKGDILVHDRMTRQTTRVSIASDGTQARSGAMTPTLSADGRFVALISRDSRLDPGTPKPTGQHVYLHDRNTGETRAVSIGVTGHAMATKSYEPIALSADGRQVAFVSGVYPNAIYIRDRLTDRSATADLAVSQTVSPDPFQPLGSLTYTLTATNQGPDVATDIRVYDRPPLYSTQVISAVPGQGYCSQGAPLICYLGTLAPGAATTVTLTVQLKWRDTTRVTNFGQVNAAAIDPDTRNNQTSLRTAAAP